MSLEQNPFVPKEAKRAELRSRYSDVLQEISHQWDTSIVLPGRVPIKGLRNAVMHIGRISLPNATEPPNNEYFAGTQWYHDSPYTIAGLLVTDPTDTIPDPKELARGMVDNLCSLYPRFGLIPARNSWTSVGRTQPPSLTRMAFDVYDHNGADDAWLGKVMRIAQSEYNTVWMDGRRFDKETGLSRFNPKYFSKTGALFEPGWDLSSRIPKGVEVVPVDLVAGRLAEYEKDFLRWADMNDDPGQYNHWLNALEQRKELVDKFFWDNESGFYYDLNNKTKQRLPLKTLAGYAPLLSGITSSEKAVRSLGQLTTFEQPGGLANTEALEYTDKQWDYPNGWPPPTRDTIESARNYGAHEIADRLTYKYLDCVQKVFRETGEIWEKYDVVNQTIGLPGRYPTQPGFGSGWTGGVFVRLLHDLTS